jgi:hypothetical protein
MNSFKQYALRALCVLGLLFTCNLLSHAQATRTWVSGVGDDANPCSRTAPCKTFVGAFTKTAANGEIDALDPGGYGPISINKSITIEGAGTIASILAGGTNSIVVNAGATDTVILRNLSLNGTAGGTRGIYFLSGGALQVENCAISNFGGSPGYGIDFEPSAASQLFIDNTTIRNNIGGGILVKPQSTGSAKVSLEDVRMENNSYGIRAEDNSKVTAHNCTAAGNAKNGFLAVSLSAPSEMNLERCVSKNNWTNGIASALSSFSGNAIVRFSYTTVTGNTTGLLSTGGGQIISVFQNGVGTNFVGGNTTDGAATGSINRQ